MSTATIPPAAPALMTAEEFLKLHGDESGVELVRGRVVRSPDCVSAAQSNAESRSNMSAATIPASGPALMTADEFLRNHGDESGVELVRGRIVRRPMSGLDHGEVCGEAYTIIREFVKPRGLGRLMTCDSYIPTGEDSFRGADVCYFSFKRLPKEIPTPRVADVPPELVIEVRSPTDRMKAIMEKIDEYLEAGVDVVLLLEPAVQTATIFRKDSDQQLSNKDELTLPDILPGFSVPVRRFFE